jgi:plasmid stability protein
MATVHVRNIPDELHEAARIEAIRAKQSLREFMISAIRGELARRGVELPETDDED